MRRAVPLALSAVLLAAAGARAQQADDAAAAASAQAYEQGSQDYQAKRYAEAEAAFRHALELQADNALALNDLAWLLLTAEDPARRNPAQALPLAERAVALEPERATFQDTLATAYDALGRHLEAARLELQVLGRDGQAFFAQQLRDFADHGLAQPEEDAGRGELLLLAARGRLLAGAKGKDLQRVLDELDQAAALGVSSGLALATRARALAALGRHGQVVSAIEAALVAGPRADEAELRRLLAASLDALGRHAEAGLAWEQASQERPADYGLRLAAARAWQHAQRADGVARVVSAAVADLYRVNPLGESQWASRLYTLAAQTYEGAIARVQSDHPALALAYRGEALRARVRAVAARAEDAKGEAGIWERLRAVGDPAADLPLEERRLRLGEEMLGLEGLPHLHDASDQLADRRGRRLAFADVDGDGDPDLYLNGAGLLLNDGQGHFALAKDSGVGGSSGGLFVDYDRDGDPDLFLAGGADRLLRNETTAEGVRFVDVTAEVADGGLGDRYPSEGAGWGDLNGDGFPDLYLANYEQGGLAKGTPDGLWLSDGKGRFRDAHTLVAIPDLSCGRGVSMADFDLDGDVDVFVSNYRLDRDLLWVNRGGPAAGEGWLHEEARERGVAGELVRGSYGHTIGSVWGDLDNDGDLDLVCANLAHPRFIDFSDKTFVYLQQPDGTFRQVREQVGISYEETHSQPVLWDMDNDGDLDLYLTAVYAGRPSTLYRNRLVEDGELRFEEVAWATSSRLFNGWGAATADVDGDGDLDLAVAAGPVHLLLNQGTGQGHHSVRVRLHGTRSDTMGAYATCVLSAPDGQRWVRQLTLGSGTTCQDEPVLHFGVGTRAGPFQLEVRWPAGGVWTQQVGLGLHDVREPEGD